LRVAGDSRGRCLVERRHRGTRIQVVDQGAQDTGSAHTVFPQAVHEGFAVATPGPESGVSVEVGALVTPGDEVSLSGCCMSGF